MKIEEVTPTKHAAIDNKQQMSSIWQKRNEGINIFGANQFGNKVIACLNWKHKKTVWSNMQEIVYNVNQNTVHSAKV